MAVKLATEPSKIKLYKLLFLLDLENAATALDGYASKGWSQRILAKERVRKDKCRDGVEMARYA